MRAVIYAAKSTEDKHGSIPTQIEDCQAMAEREGWIIAGEFQDEGFSAYSGNRGPGLEAAKRAAADLAQQHGEAVLVAQHSDRLARGGGDAPGAADHLAEVMFWSNRNDVRIRSVQDDSTFTNPLLAFAMGMRNFEDSKRKSEATRAGQRRRAEAGLFGCGTPPYGYDYQPGNRNSGERGTLIVNEAEALVVRRVYRDYLGGHSQLQIVRDLEAENVPTKRGGPWRPESVGRILRNPIYLAVIDFDGHQFPGQHAAIIDTDTWEAVATLRAARVRGPGKGRGRKPLAPFLFVGGLALRCGSCGEAMYPRSHTGKYHCHGRRQYGTAFCSQEPVRRDDVDGAVLNYFSDVALDVEGTRQQVAQESAARIAEARALREQAECASLHATQAVRRIRGYVRDGRLEPEELEDAKREEQAAKAEAQRLREREQDTQAEAAVPESEEAVIEFLTRLRTLVAGRITDADGIDQLRAALASTFDSFVLHSIWSETSPEWFHGDLYLTQGDYALEPKIKPQIIERVYEVEGETITATVASPRRIPLQKPRNKLPAPLAAR